MAPKGSETNAVAYVSGNGIKTTDPMCPGVQAHPNTMIGRDQPGSRPVVPEESWDAAPRPQREDAGGE